MSVVFPKLANGIRSTATDFISIRSRRSVPAKTNAITQP